MDERQRKAAMRPEPGDHPVRGALRGAWPGAALSFYTVTLHCHSTPSFYTVMDCHRLSCVEIRAVVDSLEGLALWCTFLRDLHTNLAVIAVTFGTMTVSPPGLAVPMSPRASAAAARTCHAGSSSRPSSAGAAACARDSGVQGCYPGPQ